MDMSLMMANGALLAAGGVPVAAAVAAAAAAGAGAPSSVMLPMPSTPSAMARVPGGAVVKRRDSGDSENRSTHSSSNSSAGGGAASSGGSGGGSGVSGDEHSPNKIFVGGISFQTTAEKLRSYFAPYGTILDVMVLKDPNTNRNRGFGFVTFADIESVNKVLNQDEHMLDGKKIDPKLATPKGQKTTPEGMIGGASMPRKVFVGGVSQETNAHELLEYFSQFGKVIECSLQMDNNTKRHRGFAFVTFDNEDHSARVVRKHHHVVKNKTVECKYAQPKETIQASERAKRAQLLTMMQTAAAAAATNPLSPLAAAAAHAQQVQQHYSRVMSVGGPAAGAGGFSGLASFRYAPYTVPVTANGGAGGPTAAGAHNAAAAAAALGHLAPLGQLNSLPAAASINPAAAAAAAAALHSAGPASLHHPAPPTVAAATMPSTYQLASFNDMAGLHGLEWGAAAPIYGMYSA